MLKLPVPSLLAVLWMLCVTAACGRAPQKRIGVVPTNDSLVTSVEGIAPEDKSLPGISYALKCDGLAEATGNLVATTDFVRFDNLKIADGTKCALEIRADVRDGLEWLSSPKSPGLYYASEAGTVTGNRLHLKLFKVYRNVDAPESEVLVETTDGGECTAFEMTTKLCVNDGNGDQPDDAMLGMSVIEESGELKLKSVIAASPAAKAGLSASDIIVTVGATPVNSVAEFAAALKSAMADTSKKQVLLNVIRNGENVAAWIELSKVAASTAAVSGYVGGRP